MKSTVFSKYLKHMKMHLESNWLFELFRTNMSSFTPERIVNASQSTVQESYQCTICDRRFRTNRGLTQHLRSCNFKNISFNVSDTVIATGENTLLDNESLRNIEIPEVRYKWGEIWQLPIWGKPVTSRRKDIVLEKKLFLLPPWRAGKQFTEETTKLMN